MTTRTDTNDQLVEREILDDIFQRRSIYTSVDAPPGAGKTYLIETVVSIAVLEYGMRVAVVTPRRAQAADLARRIRTAFVSIRVELLTRKGDVPNPALSALGVITLDTTRALNGGPGLVTSTVDKFAASYEQLSSAGFDMIIFDEAYQVTLAKALPLLALAPQIIMVGDPGQLEPFTEFAVERFDAADIGVHHSLPRVIGQQNPDVPTRKLRVTRRLPPDSVPYVQEAFYPTMPFTATATSEERRVAFRAAGMGDGIGIALDKIADGASIVMLTLPAVARDLTVDTELSDLAVEIAQRLTVRQATWVARNELVTADKMMYLDTHRASETETELRLLAAPIGRLGFRGTPEVMQGLEAPVVIARHPLSGLSAASGFDLTPGRLCVMLSRHQLACILLTRAHLPELLDAYEHDCGVRLAGGTDDIWNGFNAHRSIYRKLEAAKRIVPIV
jgi:hypothetical protein